MKILISVIFIAFYQSRKVSRIIRTHYDLPLTYRGEKFKNLVDSEYSKFEDELNQLQDKIKLCIERHIHLFNKARRKCLGENFEIYERRFNLFTFKIENVQENMIEVAFNENCMNNEQNVFQCFKLLDDIKILRFNDYLLLETVRVNKEIYIDQNFTEEYFESILQTVLYAIDKFNEFKENLSDRRIVMKGLLWNYFLEKKSEIMQHELFDENDEDIELLDQVGGEDKFFAKKLMGQISTKFEDMKKSFFDEENQQQEENKDRQESLKNKEKKPEAKITKKEIK